MSDIGQSPPHDPARAITPAQRESDTLAMVRDALAARRAALAYQPVVQAAHPDEAAFHEGLIRIIDEAGEVIPARHFMGAVETHELGRMIDCLALETGLRALAETPALRLSINMSARSIGHPDWMETMQRGLRGEPTVAERLILEITESSAMMMPDSVARFMGELQRRGISFALDDFGAGYTALRYLRDFRFDILKIDGQFIRGIDQCADRQVLVTALLSIATHFDMLSVAESVETAAEARFLTEAGLDCLQGYYFAAPTMQPCWLREGLRLPA